MGKKRQDDGGGEGSWLNTYADMITLVLTFFVALFSMSTLSQETVDRMAEGQNAGRGEASTSGESVPTISEIEENLADIDLESFQVEDMSDLAKVIQAYIEQNGLTSALQVAEGPGAVYVRFNSDVFFAANSHQLRRENTAVLDFLGDCFKQIQDQLMMINIYGHTAEVKSDDYPVSALMLSSERAASVAVYLQDESGIPSTLLTPIGQGNNFPIASNDTAEGRRQNRRVDIAVVSNKATIMDTEDVLRLLQGTFDENTYPKTGGVKDVLTPGTPNADGGQTSAEPSVPPESEPGASAAGAEGSAVSDQPAETNSNS